MLMAHPTFAGSHFASREHGIEPGVLFGTLLRIAGADIAIFANAGGRFTYTIDECKGIAARLRGPLGGLRPTLPCPAGGMSFEQIPRMCADYGPDSVLLIGGALIGHGSDLEASTRSFADAVRASSNERLEPPRPLREPPFDARASRVLAHRPGFEWSGRPSSAYKDAPRPLPGPSRSRECAGSSWSGSSASDSRTDLRYFEIEPGGYSSLEKHLHAHIVIGARGSGVLSSSEGRARDSSAPMDVACIGPLEAHQLRNESDEPFGFFCIVDHDHDRDRPAAP